MKKHFLIIFVSLVSLFFIKNANALTYTVCPAGCDSNTVQGGINLASAGDTVLIINSGIYNESVVLNKSITLTSNTTLSPTINSTSTALRIIANAATVSNLTIRFSGSATSQHAIWTNGSYTTLVNNTIRVNNINSNHGIYIQNSAKNIIYGNNIVTLSYNSYPIYITGSSTNNTIDSNLISYGASSTYGIYITANNNTIINNNITITGGYPPIYMDSYYGTVVISNNYVNGKPIIYNKNLYNSLITATTYGELILANSFNVTVSNSIFTEAGIVFINVTNSTITSSNLITKAEAVRLVALSNYNTIYNNNISTSGGDRSYGILMISGNYNNVAGNNISTTGGSYNYGIESDTINNVISSNIIKTTGTYNYGIYLLGNGNKVIGVNITTSGSYAAGIRIDSSNNNVTFSNITTAGSSATIIDNPSAYTPSALWIRGGNNNRVSDCILSSTRYYDIFVSGFSSQANYLINTAFNKTDIMFNASSNSNLYNQYYLDVYVNDSAGNPIDSATVIANDTNTIDNPLNPNSNFTTVTNSSGYIPRQILAEFMGNWTYNITNGYLYFNNYTLNTSKANSNSDSRQINMTSSFLITVTLSRVLTYSLSSINSTLAGTMVGHSLFWQDSFGLSGYIFSFDNCTGSLVNDTFVSFSGIANWSNVTKKINSITGCTIRWCVYASDTYNNWDGNSCITPFSYTTSGTTGRYFKGTIDEVRIYNRALSADDIKSIYTSGNAINPNSLATIAISSTLASGTHTVKVCTSSMCQSSYLSIQ
jgi:nitrous oxidase accessory protein NosD